MSAEIAKNCFIEILNKDYKDKSQEFEKHNLYFGLSQLAEAIENIERKISSIDKRLDGQF